MIGFYHGGIFADTRFAMMDRETHVEREFADSAQGRVFRSSLAEPPVVGFIEPTGRAAVKAGTQKTAFSFLGWGPLPQAVRWYFPFQTGGPKGRKDVAFSQLPWWWVPECF